MQREIESFALHFVGDAQADDGVDDLEQDQRDNGVVYDYDKNALDLVHHLRRVAFDQAGGAAVLLDGEHAGEQCTDNAANAVDAEAVERIVSTHMRFRPVTPQ